jgi:hypothetical protein
MAGETPRQVIIGLLEQLLLSAYAGHVDGVVLGVVTDHRVQDKRCIMVFSAGDVADAEIETSLSEVTHYIGESGYKQFHWGRVPQVQVMP